MFSLIELPRVKYVYLYTKPISMQCGENKLKELCLSEMKMDPKKDYLFLFFNRAMDQLRLFFIDYTGTQQITKVLTKGNFMLPVPKQGENVIKLEKKKLMALFRS